MKNYLVFYGENFYPSGGWLDFCGSFDSIEKVSEYIESRDPCLAWAHIVHDSRIIITAEGESEDYNEYQWKFEIFEPPEKE